MPPHHLPVSLGLDFGTESVRAILIDTEGSQLSVAVNQFRHGQILDSLPHSHTRLPEHFALQCPVDWLESSISATRQAISSAAIDPERIVGIGVDFTSCTMLPTLSDGTPLCELDSFSDQPYAWPKLWKHHGAIQQTERINHIARERQEAFLNRYGGTIGLEWFFPKLLETIDNAPPVADAAEVWIEAGDWVVWKLTGADGSHIPRSTCQAGYKAMWSGEQGYGSPEFFTAVSPRLADAVQNKMPGHMLSPGQSAGNLCPEFAKRLGLSSEAAVSAATIDAHAAVPGVGAAQPGTLVMVLGTSSCHMLNSKIGPPVPGVAGIVQGGILPDLFGYETGQAAVGDAFAWLLKLLNLASFETLSNDAMQLPPGAGNVQCMDWMNGCRTPLMDGSVKGAFTGLTLATTPAQLYRALLEASAFGFRWIVEVLREGGLQIEHFVAAGGLPYHNQDLVPVYADVLGESIEIYPGQYASAVGAAVLGMTAAGRQRTGFTTLADAATAMGSVEPTEKIVCQPNRASHVAYERLYQDYLRLADSLRSIPAS